MRMLYGENAWRLFLSRGGYTRVCVCGYHHASLVHHLLRGLDVFRSFGVFKGSVYLRVVFLR